MPAATRGHTTTLSVLDTTIRRDTEGRFCLNDCHKASGGEKAKQPANFLRLDATKDLITEVGHSSDLRSDPVAVVNGGIHRGTYVAKELVYAYAMWISPVFHLRVIRAFDAMVQGVRPAQGPAPADIVAQHRQAVALFRSMMQVSSLAGLNRQQSAAAANAVVKQNIGVDLLAELSPLKVETSILANVNKPEIDEIEALWQEAVRTDRQDVFLLNSACDAFSFVNQDGDRDNARKACLRIVRYSMDLWERVHQHPATKRAVRQITP
ncbi:KilA-N domain-containing protein [Gluconacetobacter sp. 1b LMG 1731]|uniref:KilA-N domain-containing protein n=1 Tax=Gluconacetobacter dulcium TaxID=2729096 RepID=A0A7W4NS88_9PROT|nr:KilA-N domain-containing protein [Gluconacetobacter dulcium]MBB2164354.1 KilA-N domain-containing protein [Gluconacetobacter dulcium]MBB2193576.1 KilA-N domain-containing protein [Gluconacetobacter dulcium]